jgi:hypothetical protein
MEKDLMDTKAKRGFTINAGAGNALNPPHYPPVPYHRPHKVSAKSVKCDLRHKCVGDDDALWLMYGEGFNGHESETRARWKAGVPIHLPAVDPHSPSMLGPGTLWIRPTIHQYRTIAHVWVTMMRCGWCMEKDLMDTKAKRGPVGKLALWAFYAFCAYFVTQITLYNYRAYLEA